MNNTFTPKKVLFVEDNVADQVLIEQFFTTLKPQVRFTILETGEQAINFLTGAERNVPGTLPDLIISDLNLPGKDGRDILRVVKQDEMLRHIPVIVFSSSSNAADIREVYDLHANCYLVKPMELDAYTEVMEQFKSFWVHTVRLDHVRKSPGIM